jgi:hypothetical protein
LFQFGQFFFIQPTFFRMNHTSGFNHVSQTGIGWNASIGNDLYIVQIAACHFAACGMSGGAVMAFVGCGDGELNCLMFPGG